MKNITLLLLAVIVTSCCHFRSDDGYDDLIGQGDELTYPERKAIWNFLLQYIDKDLREEIGFREAFRVNTLFMRLGRYHQEEPLRYFFSMKDVRGEEYYVLVSTSIYRNPGEAVVEINLYRNTYPVAGTRFVATPTSMHTWLGDVSVERDVQGLGDVLKIKTHWNTDETALFFALLISDDENAFQNGDLGLVRIADLYGIPNGIRFGEKGEYDGPPFPLYWQKDCDRILKEGPVAQQMQFLLWLASDHGEDKGDGLSQDWPNAPDTAAELRAYLKDNNLIQPLLDSENPWLRDAAQLAQNKINRVSYSVGFEEELIRAYKE